MFCSKSQQSGFADNTAEPPGSPVRYHLFSCQPVSHGDAPSLDVGSSLTGRRVGGAMLAACEGKSGLQVAQREGPADWTVDVGGAGLRQRLTLAHIEAHELLD